MYPLAMLNLWKVVEEDNQHPHLLHLNLLLEDHLPHEAHLQQVPQVAHQLPEDLLLLQDLPLQQPESLHPSIAGPHLHNHQPITLDPHQTEDPHQQLDPDQVQEDQDQDQQVTHHNRAADQLEDPLQASDQDQEQEGQEDNQHHREAWIRVEEDHQAHQEWDLQEWDLQVWEEGRKEHNSLMSWMDW